MTKQKTPLFDVFDKVIYDFYNPDKPKKEKPPIKIKGPKGKSKKQIIVTVINSTGSFTMGNNDSITTSILEVKTIIKKGYDLHEDEHYEFMEHQYRILGIDTYVGESCLKPFVKEKK